MARLQINVTDIDGFKTKQTRPCCLLWTVLQLQQIFLPSFLNLYIKIDSIKKNEFSCNTIIRYEAKAQGKLKN